MGRGWTILEAGNRGNVLMRSAGAQVYGDLSEWVVESGNCGGEKCEREEVPAGNSCTAMIKSAMRIGARVALLSSRENGRSPRVCGFDVRRGSLRWEELSHADLGGPRMYWARAKVSMMSIGAPQWRHRKVGLWER